MFRSIHVLAAALAAGSLGSNCDLTVVVPEGCTNDSQCDDGVFCNGDEICLGDGSCADGEPPCECSEQCNEGSNTCEDCCGDFECDDGVFCNGEELCFGGICVQGEPPCDLGLPAGCPTFCFEDDNTCAEPCEFDADCDDGVFCNGEEYCDECGICVLVDPPCGDGPGDCCNETFNECPECCDDFDCDDGLYCNGEELCVDGLCFATETPCEFDGVACPETCDEDFDECVVECLNDADCDDGRFCNGQELCAICGVCVVGDFPCDAGDVCIEGDFGAICVP